MESIIYTMHQKDHHKPTDTKAAHKIMMKMTFSHSKSASNEISSYLDYLFLHIVILCWFKAPATVWYMTAD
jgi:hypothetical protein